MRTLAALAMLCSLQFTAYADNDIPQGRLGHPLGTYLTIEGVRAETGKVGVQTLLVDTINGKKLDQPVGIWIDNVELPEGQRCIIRGYESGKMIGLPFEVAKAENIPLPQAGWQFFRYFMMTSAVQPQGLSKKPERMSYGDRLRTQRDEMKKGEVEPPAGGDGKPAPQP